MKKLKLEQIKDIKTGFEVHDILRNGKSRELDPFKVSALLQKMIDRLNLLTRLLKKKGVN